MSSEEEPLSQDVVFDILSSTRRRYVLYYLKTEGPMELTELAEHVAAQENDTEIEDLTKQQRKRVYVSLYQTHVPKLEDAGFVSYDQETGEVELRPKAHDVNQYLGDDRSSFPWQYIYLPLAIVGLALILLQNFEVWVFGALSQAELAIVLVIGLVLTASVHLIVWLTSDHDSLLDLQRE
jgi:hypothetical protein